MKPTILVTGGTGVVGRPLVEGLIAPGEHVTILSRGRNISGMTAQKNIDHMLGDVSLDRLGLADLDYRRLCLSVKKIIQTRGKIP